MEDQFRILNQQLESLVRRKEEQVMRKEEQIRRQKEQQEERDKKYKETMEMLRTYIAQLQGGPELVHPQSPIDGRSTSELGNNSSTKSLSFNPQLEIPKFDGFNARTWLNKCEKYFELCKTLDKQKVDIASSHMTGKAEHWMCSYLCIGRFVCWSEFTVDVIGKFGDETCVDRILKSDIENDVLKGRNQQLETAKMSVTMTPKPFDESPKKEKLEVEVGSLAEQLFAFPHTIRYKSFDEKFYGRWNASENSWLRSIKNVPKFKKKKSVVKTQPQEKEVGLGSASPTLSGHKRKHKDLEPEAHEPPVLMHPPNSMPCTIPQSDLKPFVQEGRGGLSSENELKEHVIKRLRPAQSVEEVTYLTTRQQASWFLDELPQTVAKSINFEEKAKNIGAALVKQVARSTNSAAGNDTTCATVLTQAIYAEGCKSITSGINVMDLNSSITMAVDAVVTNLKNISTMISTPEEMVQVATVSKISVFDPGGADSSIMCWQVAFPNNLSLSVVQPISASDFASNVSKVFKLCSKSVISPNVVCVLETPPSKRQKNLNERKSLPSAAVEKRLVEGIRKNHTLIIVGETGRGKMTQLPQFLYNNGVCRNGGVIGVTQPRHVAVVEVSKRVAEECGCPVGHQVGYAIRFEDVTSNLTRIKYMTDGTVSTIGNQDFFAASLAVTPSPDIENDQFIDDTAKWSLMELLHQIPSHQSTEPSDVAGVSYDRRPVPSNQYSGTSLSSHSFNFISDREPDMHHSLALGSYGSNIGALLHNSVIDEQVVVPTTTEKLRPRYSSGALTDESSYLSGKKNSQAIYTNANMVGKLSADFLDWEEKLHGLKNEGGTINSSAWKSNNVLQRSVAAFIRDDIPVNVMSRQSLQAGVAAGFYDNTIETVLIFDPGGYRGLL